MVFILVELSSQGSLYFSIPVALLLEYFDSVPNHAAGQILSLWLLLGIFEHREQNLA